MIWVLIAQAFAAEPFDMDGSPTLVGFPLLLPLVPVLVWMKERPALTGLELVGRSLRLSYWQLEALHLEIDLPDVREAFWERGRLVLRVPKDELVLIVPPNLMADAERLLAAVVADDTRLELGRERRIWPWRLLLISWLISAAYVQSLLVRAGFWGTGLGVSAFFATLAALIACEVQTVVLKLDGPRLRVAVSRVLPTPAWSVLLSEVRAVSVRGRRVGIELRDGARRSIPVRRYHDAERVAALIEARLVTEEPVPQEVRRIRAKAMERTAS